MTFAGFQARSRIAASAVSEPWTLVFGEIDLFRDWSGRCSSYQLAYVISSGSKASQPNGSMGYVARVLKTALMGLAMLTKSMMNQLLSNEELRQVLTAWGFSCKADDENQTGRSVR